jgi:putative transposase
VYSVFLKLEVFVMDFVSNSHSIGNNIHHLEWCTKYRYKMFRNEKFREYCKDILHMVARRHGIEILELAVMEDHVHCIVQLPPEMSQSRAVQLLKGASSYELFRLVPNYRLRYPHGNFWSKGNFKDTVGRITIETAQKYVRDQQMQLDHFTKLTGNCGL